MKSCYSDDNDEDNNDNDNDNENDNYMLLPVTVPLSLLLLLSPEATIIHPLFPIGVIQLGVEIEKSPLGK